MKSYIITDADSIPKRQKKGHDSMGNSLGFQTKIAGVTIAIVLVTVLCLSVFQIYMANTDTLRQGRDGLTSISATLAESVALQHTLMQHKLLIDRDIMKTQFELSGFPVPEVLMEAELELTDQAGGGPVKTVLPALKHGSVYLHEDNAVVRKVAELTGGVASILQLDAGRLVRVSTSLDTPVPLWGKGSFMGPGNPALEAVLAGKTWEGLVWLGGAWRMAAYAPFTDLTGSEVLGALEITHPLISDAFAEYVRRVRVGGHGGTLAFDAEGRTVVDLPGTEQEAAAIIAAGNGVSTLQTADGRSLEVSVRHFEPWNLTFATWVATDDLMAGVRERLVRNALVGMPLPLVLSVALIGIAGRVLLAPVRRMAVLADEVAAGNYTATISYPARDSIGQLAAALNSMVARSREMLAEIVSATDALSGASSELGTASGGLTENSAGTARRARAVHDSARAVSENMHSVSAAMEQATVNVGTVARSTAQLAATIQGVAQSADLARRTTADAVGRAGETTRHMEQLSQAAREIGTVTATISAISSQTNLLALNATIEAARAGATGRGFAVVAGEIKELSQQTAGATENIRSKVSAIQNVTEVTAREIGEIIGVIEEMNEIVASISEAMEEQAVMTRDISENVGQAAQGIAEINLSVTSSSSMTRDISGEIEGVLASSTAMRDESAVVQQRSDSLAGLAARLQALVSRFRF
jgi:methyl-accepting chemotaxis protein